MLVALHGDQEAAMNGRKRTKTDSEASKNCKGFCFWEMIGDLKKSAEAGACSASSLPTSLAVFVVKFGFLILLPKSI